MVTVTTVLGDLTSAQMRLLGELAPAYRRRHGAHHLRSEPGVPLGAAAATVEALYARLRAAGLSRAGAVDARRRDQLPGRRVVQARRDAVARPRPAARPISLHERPDLVAAVPGLDIKISGCPNGCGQHHIAGIGFQGSLRKVGGRPAPHYFVMVGGGVAERHRRRSAATSRRSRRAAASRRSSGWCSCIATRARRPKAPLAFFRRVEVPRVKALLADLEKLAPEAPRPRRTSSTWQKTTPSTRKCRMASAAPERVDTMTTTRPFTPDSVHRSDRPHAAAAPASASAPDTPGVEIYAKAEFQNPGGSVKDRAAASILRDGERTGRLHTGVTILDATSGNTGIAYAMICRGARLPPQAVRAGQRHAGADAHAARLRRRAGADRSRWKAPTARFARRGGSSRRIRHRYFYADQYNNDANWRAHYETTGAGDPRADRRAHHALRRRPRHQRHVHGRRPPAARVQPRHPADLGPARLAAARRRRAEAHGDGDQAGHLRSDSLADEDVRVSHRAAPIRYTRRLAAEEGMLVGVSSGAALAACARSRRRGSAKASIVMVFPDSGTRYLTERFWEAEDALMRGAARPTREAEHPAPRHRDLSGRMLWRADRRRATSSSRRFALPNTTAAGPRRRFLIGPDDYRLAEARARGRRRDAGRLLPFASRTIRPARRRTISSRPGRISTYVIVRP